MIKEIWVTTKVVGFHQWPDAPDEVSFLQNRHRHEFHFKAGFIVQDSNRELEFFLKQRDLSRALTNLYTFQGLGFKFGSRSCEMIAEELLEELDAAYVECSEDGENGAVVYKEVK